MVEGNRSTEPREHVMRGRSSALALALALSILIETDGTPAIPMLAVTVQDCPTPKGVMEQEAAYIDALHGAARYRLLGDCLEIEDAAGETMLVLTCAQ